MGMALMVLVLLAYWKTIFWSLLCVILVALTNSQWFLVPFPNGIYFAIYTISIAILTTWSTLKIVQYCLQHDDGTNPLILNGDFWTLFQLNQPMDLDGNKPSIGNLSEDINKYFIKRWFMYISSDEKFPMECKLLLEEVLERFLNVEQHINYMELFKISSLILLRHVKEYKRALRRLQKSTIGTNIESVYRYSHYCTNSPKSSQFYVHQLTTNLLNRFINWELRNSLPCHVLVSVIARKVVLYVLNLVSEPSFLNYHILNALVTNEKKQELNINAYNRLVIERPGCPNEEMMEPIEDTVTVHVPKMGHCQNTWRDSRDLKAISIGQDVVVDFLTADFKTPSNEEPQLITVEHTNSPDVEYEESADLASSIAKLRSLLEQKSSESLTCSEDGSSNTLDEEFTDETDGLVPSFYKLCAKTATGVLHNTLNTLKTALPANMTDGIEPMISQYEWGFKQCQKNNDFIKRIRNFVRERDEFCTIDTAYEAFDSLHNYDTIKTSCGQYDDDPDDFAAKFPTVRILIDTVCELLSECQSESALLREPVIKTVLLLFGNSLEQFLGDIIKYAVKMGRNQLIRAVPVTNPDSEERILTLTMDQLIELIIDGIPDHVKILVSESDLNHIVQFVIESVQSPQINSDILLQIFEVLFYNFLTVLRHLPPPTEF